jgi:formylglycine-generating enzyme required for sulfatase activity
MSAKRASLPAASAGCWALAVLSLCVCRQGVAAADELEIKNSVGMTLRLLPAGRFERGDAELPPGFSKDHSDFASEDERPVHPVVLTRPFYLATAEVTLGQFRKFVEAASYKTTAQQSEQGAVGWDPKPPAGQPDYISTFRASGGFSWLNPGFPQTDDHPVVGVSFADAQAFCAWLGQQEKTTYRLPTEAEWEYAARAGTTSYFSFGDNYRGQIHLYANLGNVELERAFPERARRQWLIDVNRDPPDQHVFTAPVGSYRANPWGLFDLHGNVWEWCADRYLDTAYAPFTRAGHQEVRRQAVDPINEEKTSADGDWRVIRGGSWFNAPIQCRSATRGYFEANDAASYLGFRVVRDASAEADSAARSEFERSEAARATLERITGGLRERRDDRLTVLLRPEHLTEELFAALAEFDRAVDVVLDAQGRLSPPDIAGLARTRRLTGLTLSGCGAAPADDDFAPLASHSELEQLQISGTPKLSDKLLSHLPRSAQFESLQFDAEGISDAGLQTLGKQPRLKALYLGGTAVQGSILEHFGDAPLERFSCSQLTDAGAVFLSRFSRLRELQLSGSPLSGAGCAQLSHLTRLQRLDVSWCRQIPDEAFAVLGALSELQGVTLTETSAGDRAVAALAGAADLRDLRLGSENLSDGGVRQLCGLASLGALSIQTPANVLTDAAFSDLWRLVNLNQLEISVPRITGEGLSSLRELPRLETLVLNGPDTSDLALRNAARSRSLKRLVVGNPQSGVPAGVTDEGLLALAAARSLQHIDLVGRREQFSDAALKQLRAQRSGLTLNVP